MRPSQRQYSIFFLLQVVLFTSPLKRATAQSLAQDIEQLTLDYQKLGQLKQMLSDMVTAYGEIKQEYEQLKSIASGNFSLHKAFLDALLAVSPMVRDYAKVKAIIDKEAGLVKEYQVAKNLFAASGRFSSGELRYLDALYGNLLSGSLENLDELATVLADGDLRMSDAERLAAIDRIDRDMTEKLSFLKAFNSQTAIMAGQRGLEAGDIRAMRSISAPATF